VGASYEWYSSNTTTPYPFIKAQPNSIHEIFTDAYISHNSVTPDPPMLVRVSKFDTVSAIKEVELRYSNGSLLAYLTSTSDSFQATSFGRYIIYQWKRITTQGNGLTDEDIVARFVILAEKANLLNIAPVDLADAYLLRSVVNPHIPRVRRIAVGVSGFPCCLQTPSEGPVILQAGTNMTIGKSADPLSAVINGSVLKTVRSPVRLQFDAIAGAGSGLNIVCVDPAGEIKTISGQGPKLGNVLLQGEGCTWVEAPFDSGTYSISPPIPDFVDYKGTLEAAMLRLHADCKACCDCEDYKAAYEKLSDLWNRALAVSQRIETARKNYNTIVTDIIADYTINVKVRAISRPDYAFAVGAVLSNNTDKTLFNIKLTFTITPLGAEYIDGSGYLDAPGFPNVQADAPSLQVIVPSLAPAKIATYSFEVRYPRGSPRTGTATIVCVASAPPYSSSGTLTLELLKPLFKD
jgi:hypothetical protein